ncbi:cytochrome P450 [Aspergillus vadensis CBS 113365]|uniref:Cytochrome P450 monooxygenase n=1 Tax=Aspergillus vadensis (strain CBS 113365 / IMI 142717 / IBT 24658) TaxID=1448311 RepID=A0A319B331_ASPVC|nr:cytochrome P450 monooxygenase [Aspergillus vadensis CBS 113365]PYH66909.1 cytochrome P450 monooxygenase [Aspergillus vadensis CBS 113365]
MENMLGYTSMPVPVLISLALGLSLLLLRKFTYKDTALNPKRPFELTSTRVKQEFFFNAQRLLRDWFATHPNTPVPLHTDVGKMTMLPPSMANEIRNNENLSFSRWAMKAFHGNLPGFDGFRESGQDSGIVQAVIANDLTKYLNKVTEPLADETSVAVRELLTDNDEWHTIHLSGVIVALISRISSRVFLGEKLCRNEEWLRITQSYTIDGFLAMTELRMWPAAIHPIVHWFLPRCRKLRSQVSTARKVMRPILEERRQLKEGVQAEGKQSPIFDDAIEWFEKAAKGRPYDPVGAQLIVSVGALHTTSDLTCQTMTHLTALYNMKLLDSVIRESQRLKPVTNVSMRRMALKEVKLSDGTVIPKNGMLAVSAHKLWDDDTYENATSWDGYRFYKMRDDPERQTQAQLVTTAPENLAFGHGKHACPGRFFAANEVKIVLIYLLLRYDWKLLEGTVPRIFSGGFGMALDPTLKMEVRRRREEMEI